MKLAADVDSSGATNLETRSTGGGNRQERDAGISAATDSTRTAPDWSSPSTSRVASTRKIIQRLRPQGEATLSDLGYAAAASTSDDARKASLVHILNRALALADEMLIELNDEDDEYEEDTGK